MRIQLVHFSVQSTGQQPGLEVVASSTFRLISRLLIIHRRVSPCLTVELKIYDKKKSPQASQGIFENHLG